MRKIIMFAVLYLGSLALHAQDVDSLLNSMTDEPIQYAEATFKATRIVNGHSVEQMKAGQLDFRIHHRFGELAGGAYEFWGLDQSSVMLSLELGLTDRLMIGATRSTYGKTATGFAKYKILRQSTGEKRMPISMNLFTEIEVNGLKWADTERTNYFSSRLSYVTQLLIARKFSESLSVQLSPTYIHRNLVPEAIDFNDIFAVGIGGRYKLNKRVSVNAEYFYTIHYMDIGKENNPNSLSFGVDIETGGHVFQLFLTNSMPMFERGFITETTGKWLDGGIHFGFNISRVFSLYRK